MKNPFTAKLKKRLAIIAGSLLATTTVTAGGVMYARHKTKSKPQNPKEDHAPDLFI